PDLETEPKSEPLSFSEEPLIESSLRSNPEAEKGPAFTVTEIEPTGAASVEADVLPEAEASAEVETHPEASPEPAQTVDSQDSVQSPVRALVGVPVQLPGGSVLHIPENTCPAEAWEICEQIEQRLEMSIEEGQDAINLDGLIRSTGTPVNKGKADKTNNDDSSSGDSAE
ncbi:Dynein heavy chain 8, axonemal, partial [Frankliniella fusca]